MFVDMFLKNLIDKKIVVYQRGVEDFFICTLLQWSEVGFLVIDDKGIKVLLGVASINAIIEHVEEIKQDPGIPDGE